MCCWPPAHWGPVAISEERSDRRGRKMPRVQRRFVHGVEMSRDPTQRHTSFIFFAEVVVAVDAAGLAAALAASLFLVRSTV